MIPILIVVSLAISACSPSSSPEGAVNACIEALNTRDRDKFVSLWSPDLREEGRVVYEGMIQREVKISGVKPFVLRDDPYRKNTKTTVIQGTITSVNAREGMEFNDGGVDVEQIDGRWYIRFFLMSALYLK